MADMSEDRDKRIAYAEERRILDVTLVIEDIWKDHNISAIFRTFESFGFKNIMVVGEPSKHGISHKSIDFGSQIHLNIEYFETISDAAKKLKSQGTKIYGTHFSEDATPLSEFKVHPNIAIVLGNEKKGISEETAKICDGFVWIPSLGLTRSLNVSVATGIILFEILRQKKNVLGEIDYPLIPPFFVYPGDRE